MAASHVSHNAKVSHKFRNLMGIGNSKNKKNVDFWQKNTESNWPSKFGLFWLVYMDTFCAFCTIENRKTVNGAPCPYFSKARVNIWAFAPRTTYLRKPFSTTSWQHNIARGLSWKGPFFNCHFCQFHHLACKFDSAISAAWLMTSKLKNFSLRQSYMTVINFIPILDSLFESPTTHFWNLYVQKSTGLHLTLGPSLQFFWYQTKLKPYWIPHGDAPICLCGPYRKNSVGHVWLYRRPTLAVHPGSTGSRYVPRVEAPDTAADALHLPNFGLLWRFVTEHEGQPSPARQASIRHLQSKVSKLEVGVSVK